MYQSINIKEYKTTKISKHDFALTQRDIECLLKSEEDIEKGRTRNASEVFMEFKEKYGFWFWII